jgi:NAD-dependent deacetylase
VSDRRLAEAIEWIRGAAEVVVSTGAGMSRESGIPTFRDAQEGLWARYDPEELATVRGFRTAPARVWGWYDGRRRRILESAPHAGHHALARLENALPALTVVTQNIDGLHQAAGSRRVVELHGSILRAKCLDRGHPFEGELSGGARDTGSGGEVHPPECPRCGSPLRPDVVWFGELLPEAAVEEAWRLGERCDVMIVVGTSGLVWPAAELPFVAARAGARVIEINPEPSEITRIADVFLKGRAGEILPRIADSIAPSTRSPS